MESFGSFNSTKNPERQPHRRLIPAAVWQLEPELVVTFGSELDTDLERLEEHFRSFWTNNSLKRSLRR